MPEEIIYDGDALHVKIAVMLVMMISLILSLIIGPYDIMGCIHEILSLKCKRGKNNINTVA